uniref:Arrestin C-terminal-like domain-containing protein n=1 Tax=Plectus sambesii TaxID=2011161 RepID=A0A914UTG4_9BILA
MEVVEIKLRGGEFARADTQFEVEFEVAEKRRPPPQLDNFPTNDAELDGKARVLIIGYVLVSRAAFDPIYYEFSNEEQVFGISGPGVYAITVATPISYPSTISEREFEVKYFARVSLKPWEVNDFVEREFVLIRPITRFDIALHHRKYVDAQSDSSEKTTKRGDAVGLTAHIDDPHPFGVGETVYVNYSIHANSSKPAIKRATAKFIRATKVKVPNNVADEAFEFIKILYDQKLPFPTQEGGDQLGFLVTSNLPSLEECPTSVHWNIVHVHYFILLSVDLKDGQKIEVKLPLLCRGDIDIDDKVDDDDENAFPIDIPPTTYSPSLQRVAKITHVDGRRVVLLAQESEVFPLLRVFYRGEVVIRKPTTVERTYTFIDHRTDFFNYEMASGRNELAIGFEQEAFDTFVAQHKMMPMSFESPWIAIVYICRIYGLKNSDFIETSFEWTPQQCPGFDAMLKEFNRVSEAPINRKEVVDVGSKKKITCELNLHSRKAFIGDPISINATVEHTTNKKFSKIVAQLVQNVHYRIPQRNDMVYQDFSRVISEYVSEDLVWDDVKLHLPEGIPPTVHCDWDILDISYVFLFKAIPKGITKPLVEIAVPILLGDRGSAKSHSANSLKESHVHLQPVDDNEDDRVDDDDRVEHDQQREDSFLSNRTRDVNKSEIEEYTDDEELIGGVREPTFISERSPSQAKSHALSPVENLAVVPSPRHHRKKHRNGRSPQKSPRLSPMPSEAPSPRPHRKKQHHHRSPHKSPRLSPVEAPSPRHHRKKHHKSPRKHKSPRPSPGNSPRRSPRPSPGNSPGRSPRHSPARSPLLSPASPMWAPTPEASS